MPPPLTITIVDDDVFYDTPNLSPDWLPPFEDELQLEQPVSYSSSIISSLVDSSDALDNYKSILAFTSEAAFFNYRYTRLD